MGLSSRKYSIKQPVNPALLALIRWILALGLTSSRQGPVRKFYSLLQNGQTSQEVPCCELPPVYLSVNLGGGFLISKGFQSLCQFLVRNSLAKYFVLQDRSGLFPPPVVYRLWAQTRGSLHCSHGTRTLGICGEWGGWGKHIGVKRSYTTDSDFSSLPLPIPPHQRLPRAAVC